MGDKYQVRNTSRAEIKYIENGIEKSRIEEFVGIQEGLLVIYGSNNKYDEASEYINTRSLNFISVKWLDMKMVKEVT
ncbi:hypothetical protein KAT92_06455 [Candidatus Babeliales bacterium]|nr:hypothetical protein [Candidatus Babeliales bacterium]